MGEARERFAEAAAIITQGLETGTVDHDGAIFRQPRRDIRPRPPRSFAGRTFAAAVSPESIEVIAKLGMGMMIIPQRTWQTHEEDAQRFRDLFVEAHGAPPPPGIMAGWIFVDEDGDRAREVGRRYMIDYYRSVVAHYEIGGEHFARTKGYEHYATNAAAMREHGEDAAADAFAQLQIAGTPAEVFEQIAERAPRMNIESFLAVVSYGSMPPAEAERNLRCFSDAVRPKLQALPGAGVGRALAIR
jgi:alkanesulfonate monooxygenase SsuD/methylene tetrahydromethanopterin reductase-like flavin-dependent oxidoreductase (luciferase family)